MNPRQKAIPCCTIEHLITLQKLSSLLPVKKTVNGIIVNSRKATKKKKRKKICFVSQALSMQRSTCLADLIA